MWWRGPQLNPRPSAHGSNALTTYPPLRSVTLLARFTEFSNLCLSVYIILNVSTNNIIINPPISSILILKYYMCLYIVNFQKRYRREKHRHSLYWLTGNVIIVCVLKKNQTITNISGYKTLNKVFLHKIISEYKYVYVKLVQSPYLTQVKSDLTPNNGFTA